VTDDFLTRRMLREAGIPDEWTTRSDGRWYVQNVPVRYDDESELWRFEDTGLTGRSLRRMLWLHRGVKVGSPAGRRGKQAIGKKITGFAVPDELLTRLERYARREGLPRAEAIRTLIAERLDEIEGIAS